MPIAASSASGYSTTVGGCQFFGRMVISFHTLPQTASDLPFGRVTRQQSLGPVDN